MGGTLHQPSYCTSSTSVLIIPGHCYHHQGPYSEFSFPMYKIIPTKQDSDSPDKKKITFNLGRESYLCLSVGFLPITTTSSLLHTDPHSHTPIFLKNTKSSNHRVLKKKSSPRRKKPSTPSLLIFQQHIDSN